MRAFGIGIFLTGASLAGYQYLFPNELTADTRSLEKQVKQYEKQVKAQEKEINELKEQLENHQASSDTDEVANKQTETASKTEKTSSGSKTKAQADATGDVVEATIYVYEDVSIYTIGQQAEDLGIVKNGRELELYLAKPEYARSIQKGAFDLRSDMTIEEIAKVLTGKK